MSERMDFNQESILRDLILNTRTPLVFRKFCPNWKCFDCPIEEWCKRFDASVRNKMRVEFEQMPMKFYDGPQWERFRKKIEITFTEFLNVYSKDVENWSAFNYGRTTEIPLECRYDIDFTCFGFPHAANDLSFWLSSKGANTSCHYDTYGCNIVVQVYGRKHWLLFPPGTQLTPTRVPYEESSVYCSENFFSPKNLESLSVARYHAFECILEEGDVLIVPRNWWHYVESLETSLSVNTWIPLKIDIDAQVEECIVKYIIEKNVSGETVQKKQYILNPNQLQLITSNEELFQILRFLLQSKMSSETSTQGALNNEKYLYEYLPETKVRDLMEKSLYDITALKSISPNEFDNLMLPKTKRNIKTEPPESSKIDPIHEALLNSMCHPDVIKIIKDKFLKTYSSSI